MKIIPKYQLQVDIDMIKLNVNSLIFSSYVKEVSINLEEIDFKDAVHLVRYSCEDTFKVLKCHHYKHPPSNYLNDPPLNDCSYLRVSTPVM